MTEEEFQKQMAAARKRVAAMDKVDGYKEWHHRTIYLAMECGVRCPESGAQFDALVMLENWRDILNALEDSAVYRSRNYSHEMRENAARDRPQN